MRIASVHVQNFRSLRDNEIEFDDVTTFVGPNGSGKSTVLHALDWFFNGERSQLDESDLYSGATDDNRKIQVRVTFRDLSESDRHALGPKYARTDATEFTAWRSWEAGQEKITGKALAFLPFEQIRMAEGAAAKRAALAKVREEYSHLELPTWSTVTGTDAAMNSWEEQNPTLLEEATISDSHFFGFYGQGKLSGLFDYVFVSADLRAAEQAVDGKGTIVGRILEKAVDRSAALREITDLVSVFSAAQEEINDRILADQLRDLAGELTTEIEAFALGRRVELSTLPIEVRPQTPRIDVSIMDSSVETSVSRQGHGFQRTLMVAALKLLAGRGAAVGSPGTMCLAIEEPELYQHPTQALALASVLRSLAEDPSGAVQVAYATHSPYFVEPRYFDQIRRVTRRPVPGGFPRVRISRASIDSVCAKLAGFESESAVRSRLEQICLKHLSEAFFADGVILVEGDGDKAILEGAAGASNELAVAGVAVAAADGKTAMLIPHAILSELQINTMLIFDNDSGVGQRMRDRGKGETDIGLAEITNAGQNQRILRYFGLPEQEQPVGILSPNLVALDDRLESMLQRDWPDWEKKRAQLVKEGRGIDGKNVATYSLAARECESSPTGELARILGAVVGG